ncbi:MAG: type II toxin-antitoxin system RelE/ParE family toxin [Candidatus Latescibacteria bacterium]|jgi:phage-related protein|nr:type II toxin-antitoxin system RelE/ParE family toxin [Candidatus Latescibacterota bacterium]
MPETTVVFYCDENRVPVLDWLKELKRKDRQGYAKCIARIRMLSQMGHELRRPLADYLDQGIYELRIRRGRVNYRILYFFHGQEVSVLTHAITKEDQIPRGDLNRAVERKKGFEAKPALHSFEGDVTHG